MARITLREIEKSLKGNRKYTRQINVKISKAQKQLLDDLIGYLNLDQSKVTRLAIKELHRAYFGKLYTERILKGLDNPDQTKLRDQDE